MTIVTADLRDVAGISDNTRWLFTTILRESGDGDAIVTSRTVPVQPVLGVLTVDLDPGYCEVRFGGRKLAIDVPDTGSPDLWDLIAAAIAFPPETRSEQVAAAVLSYLDLHPIAWEDVDKPAVVAAGDNLAAVWAVLGTVPTDKLPNLAMVQYKGMKADQAAMLATTGELGDWITRTDTGGAFIITGSDPTQLASWTALPYPALDADLTAIGALSSAANKVAYATGSGTWALTDFTPTGRTIAGAADATAARNTIEALGRVQAAKNPDLLVTGAITVDSNDLITSAAVVWPDGSPGTLTITSRDANNAVLAYNITYGSPVTKTYTQPTITRNTNGAATDVPAIVVT